MANLVSLVVFKKKNLVFFVLIFLHILNLTLIGYLELYSLRPIWGQAPWTPLFAVTSLFLSPIPWIRHFVALR